MGFSIYIGRKSCGCKVACCIDRPEYKKDTAKDISRWIKDGWTVEHLVLADGEAVPIVRCIHNAVLVHQSDAPLLFS